MLTCVQNLLQIVLLFKNSKKFLSSPFSAFSSFPLLSLSLKNSNWTARQLWLGSWLAEDIQEVRLRLAADGFCWSHRSFNTSRCLSCAAGWLSFLLEQRSNTQDAHRSRFHSAFVIHWLSCVPRGGQRLVRKRGFRQFFSPPRKLP